MKTHKCGDFTLYPFNKYDPVQQKFIEDLCPDGKLDYIGDLKKLFYEYEPKTSIWNNDHFVGLDDTLIGYVFIYDQVFPLIGFAVHPAFRGNSYGKKIIIETCKHIFNKDRRIKEIEARVDPKNIHSINSLTAAGFEFEEGPPEIDGCDSYYIKR